VRLLCWFVAGWVGLWSAAPAHGAGLLRIAESQYHGPDFIEITSVGDGSLDLFHWSHGNDTELLAVGAPVTERSGDAFRASWDLATNLAILGSDAQRLGRAEALNTYDAAPHLVDGRSYDDAASVPGDDPSSDGIPPADLPGFTAQQFDRTLPEPVVSVTIGLALAALGLYRRSA